MVDSDASGHLRTVAVLTAVVGLPLIVAVVALSRRQWSPVLDLAMTELRVRDVGSRDTPLIGLPGRIGNFPDQGSHPGPLSFYLLAPTYRIFGAGAWSMELGSVLIHLAGLGACLSLAWRRGRARLCTAFAVVLALVVGGYGTSVLTQPWNPYLPLVAWLVVLLAAWSILEGDAPAMVYFVVAGSFVAQTHVPYLALVASLAATVAVLVVARSRLAVALGRRDGSDRVHPALQSVEMPGARRWGLVALGVGAVLWLAPAVDQIFRTPGNLAMLADYFRSPPESIIGLRAGSAHLLRHLDLIHLASHALDGSGYFTAASFDLDGSVLPGAVLVVVWAASAVLAWRLRHRALVHLHAVVGTALVVALIAMSRIFGKLWYYLTLWAWGLLALCVFAIAWTIACGVCRYGPRLRAGTLVLTRAVGLGLLAASTVASTWNAVGTAPPEDHLSESLTAVVGPTVDALEAGIGGALGRSGRYVVTWSDSAYFGSQGYGLVNELERRGFDVGVPYTWRVPVTPQRVLDAADATAEIHLATGSYIDEWRAVPGAEQVAFADLRSAAQSESYDRLRRGLTAQLQRLGLADLIASLDTNLFGVQLDPRVPAEVQAIVNRMLLLGQPVAVFIVPAGTSQ